MNAKLSCRFCGADLTHTFADLGETPLANAYLRSPDDPDPAYPLHVRVCSSCLLVQLPEVVSPEEIFEDYAYFSGYSTSWLEHCRDFSEMAIKRFQLTSDSLVVEIASNDGHLLRFFQEASVPVLGVEPARNVAAHAVASGVPTEARFFGSGLAAELVGRGHRPDLVVANNVLAHVPDINDFVAGVAALLGTKGTAVFEFPHLVNLMAGIQYDTIYHEHFSYFSLLAVESIFEQHGLVLVDAERLPTHGGSLRIFAESGGQRRRRSSDRLTELRHLETRAGLGTIDTYLRFGETVDEVRKLLRAFFDEVGSGSSTIAAYGAAAKGNTLLNTAGVTSEMIDYVADRNPHKQGLVLPGSHVPIVDPCRIYETKPDYLLILPWNLAPEITTQMADIRSWGGRFVIPIPSVRVL